MRMAGRSGKSKHLAVMPMSTIQRGSPKKIRGLAEEAMVGSIGS
jgi:hypothetical protein